MSKSITIQRKTEARGDDGHKVVSVRMKEDLISRLDEISDQANRSRNEVINLLLEAAVDIVEIN